MTDFPETRDSLLLQVRSPANREAWDRFVQVYRPVIYRLARRRGLQHADAEDLAQRVLISVASAIGTWEKSGEAVRFRHWLGRVARNAILNALSRQPRDRAGGGAGASELLAERPDPDPGADAEVEYEYRRELYLRAASRVRGDVRADTWRAFEMTVVEGRGIDEAAAELGMAVGSVYAARSRIIRRLRTVVGELEDSEP